MADTAKQYEEAWALLSDDAQAEVRRKAVDTLDGYLMYSGEPKSYAGYRDLTNVMVMGMVAWLISKGYVVVPAIHRPSDEERLQREERNRPAEPEPTMSGPGMPTRMPVPSRYL